MDTLRWDGERLWLLDQRVLPQQEIYLPYDTAQEVALAITDMVVRGAPAIGITAAFGVVLEARQLSHDLAEKVSIDWPQAMLPALTVLRESRPTAVNLFWAINQAEALLAQAGDVPAVLEAWAKDMLVTDIQTNRHMGVLGAALLAEDSVIYTHCNAGALATGGYGTALGVIRAAHTAGKVKQVFAGETRPWLQGARLTAWELSREQIPVSIVVEGAAGHIIGERGVDWVIVGADRVAANGDVANKVGTFNLAILAQYHGARLMVVAPTSTIDMSTPDGRAIPIEQRPAEEVTHWRGETVAPAGVHAENPAFDVTPASLVSALVTERGVVLAPDTAKLQALFAS
ncbi:MAG: S-methyl-5-thioribose-1-phosphate isomerase [Pseudomonadales bacterium]